MTDLEPLTLALRALVYVGSIAMAGGAIFIVRFPRAAMLVMRTLERQLIVGFVLLLVVEPLRYGVFQLTIADGDWGLAFGPDMRAMAFETPIGKAALVRLGAGAVLLLATLRHARATCVLASAVMIGSFLIEGHTAGSGTGLWPSALLGLHLAGVHWWIGALFPLAAVTRLTNPAQVVPTIEAFGNEALWMVGALVAAGVLLIVWLTGGALDPANAYQQRLALKLALVAGLLAIAAYNRRRLTPALRTDFAPATRRLRNAIHIEAGVAFAVLAATAWLTAVSPDV